MDDAVFERGAQASPIVAGSLERELVAFLAPLLTWLDGLLDKRLVRTLAQSIVALLEWRNRAHGLLLSELGAYLLNPAHAPAGTKRLSNLLRSPKWDARVISDYLWRQAQQRLQQLEALGETALLVWDSSVLEKPESLAASTLGSVRSSKAQRLTRIKPGFSHPPTRPLFVPGWRWLGLLLLGRSAASGPPSVAQMHWWSNRGPYASDRRREEGERLQVCAQTWGRRVCHGWDRGFAGRAWLDAALAFGLRFVIRWPGRHTRLSARTGWTPTNAWRVARGLRSWEYRLLSGCAASLPPAHGCPGCASLAACGLGASDALVAGRRAARAGARTLVAADQRPGRDGGGRLAGGLQLCAPLADRDELALEQK